jgi:hypothetical protein
VATLAVAAAAADALPADASASLRWESCACVLDALLEVPYAWGWASAARAVPALLSELSGLVVTAPAGAAGAVVRWLARAAADAHFVPVDVCSALVAGGGAAAAVDCARGTSLMVFIFADRFPLGMVIDEAAAAASELALGDGLRRLPLRLLKMALAATAPGGGTVGYFVAMHLESAFETWLRTS